jgi:hypothetical protein
MPAPPQEAVDTCAVETLPLITLGSFERGKTFDNRNVELLRRRRLDTALA